MTVSLSYDANIGRVQISATGIGSTTRAAVERSVDGIRWTTVRGGTEVPVVGGAFTIPLDDYEYPTGVPITYRVRGLDPSTGTISYVGVGTGSSGSSGSRTPGMPAGIASGDLLLLMASTRNNGTPDTPAGWVHLVGSGNMRLYGRIWNGVFTAPTVTFTGGAAGEDTLAQIAAFRGASLTSPVSRGVSTSSPVQNIGFLGLSDLPLPGMLVVYGGWKADDWTSVSNITDGYTHEISELTSTAGSDAGQVWDYYLPDTADPIFSDEFVVTGGAAAINRAFVIALRPTSPFVTQTAAITPAAGQVWLKSIARPFLNRQVDVRFTSSIVTSRRSRTGIFPIIGRTLPVAVSTVRTSREWTMLVRTGTVEQRDDLDMLLASGDVLLVQAPDGAGIETGYVVVGDVTRQAHPLRPLSLLYTMPMTEVAPPGPDVIGAAGTWQTVINRYPTWADVIADNATWADVLALVGDSEEVVVP